MPRPIIQGQSLVIFQTIGANLHQAAVLGATPWASIQPDDRPLSVSDVLVLVVPKEKVSVVLRCDFDVAVRERGRVSKMDPSLWEGWAELLSLPSMHLDKGC